MEDDEDDEEQVSVSRSAALDFPKLALTFYLQSIEDVCSHGIHLQLTGALTLHLLIQEEGAVGGGGGDVRGGGKAGLEGEGGADLSLTVRPWQEKADAVQGLTRVGRSLSSGQTCPPGCCR